jgi:hypothetical protein
MEFIANVVESNTDTTVVHVIFADPETNPDQPMVLLFSRSIDIEESDYYFEINDQSFGQYGGLTAVQLSRSSITVLLEPGVAQDFGDQNLANVQVHFDIDDQTYQSIVATLQSIFAGTTVLVVQE